MEVISLSKQQLEKLNCENCKKSLSVPPIMVLEDKFFCGRCKVTGTRVTIYEELAKLMKFPCAYEDCIKVLSWGNVLNHENFCPHKPFKCPVRSCNDLIPSKTIPLHFQQNHGILFYKNEAIHLRFQFGNQSHKKVFLVLHKDNPYFVFIITNPKLAPKPFRISVFSVNPVQNNVTCTVSMTVFMKNLTESNLMETLPIVKYNELKHNEEYLLSKSVFNNENFDENAEFWLKLKIKIENKNEYNNLLEEQQSSDNLMTKTYVLLDGLEEGLKCLICYEKLSLPIYICNTGHTICKYCKVRLSICPYCAGIIEDSRNYALEHVVEIINLFNSSVSL